jgi:ankyrin repeat protein
LIEQKGTNNVSLILVAASRNTNLEYLLPLSTKNINEITNEGYTPIMFALLSDNIEGAETLIRHGAIIDSYTQSGNSAKSIEYWLANEYVVEPEKKSHIMERLNKAVAKKHTP